MNSYYAWILIIASLTAVVCVLPGIFLVLRGVALMSDAISHAVLLGIVIMFLLVQSIHSPLLIIGAALAGVATVFCTEWLIQSRCLKKDAAIGIVFPLFFSVGVILISYFARNVHLDLDMILLGELAFAPFNRLIVNNYDIGPQAFWVLLTVLCINGLFVWLFYKELLLATFDEDYALLQGFYPKKLYYVLMLLTSITAVAAFDIVGSVVVVALMITPVATAYLITDRMHILIMLSLFFGILAAMVGYMGASLFDVSIGGAIAATTGLYFILILFLHIMLRNKKIL